MSEQTRCTCPPVEVTSYADLARDERHFVPGHDRHCPVHGTPLVEREIVFHDGSGEPKRFDSNEAFHQYLRDQGMDI